MKIALFLVVLAFASADETGNPIGKVIQMITDLEGKIIGEGEACQKNYEELAGWCDDRSKELQFEIKTGKQQVAELSATIQDESANIEALTEKINELSASIAANEKDLKEATAVR